MTPQDSPADADLLAVLDYIDHCSRCGSDVPTGDCDCAASLRWWRSQARRGLVDREPAP